MSIFSNRTVEDRENKHAYTGNAEPAHNHASHVLLSYTGTHFTMYPVEFYKFKPIVGYKTLDINEAENLVRPHVLCMCIYIRYQCVSMREYVYGWAFEDSYLLLSVISIDQPTNHT